MYVRVCVCLYVRAAALERSAEGPVVAVSICAGFSAADIFAAGPSVTVTVDLLQFAAPADATAFARGIADGQNE